MIPETKIYTEENSDIPMKNCVNIFSNSSENNTHFIKLKLSDENSYEDSKNIDEEILKKIFSKIFVNIIKSNRVIKIKEFINEFTCFNLISQILIELQIIVFLYLRFTEKLFIFTLFSCILNFYPHRLKQRFWISLINLSIIFLNPSLTLCTSLIYITALPQIFRLHKFKKIYIFFRPYRIIFGPINGLLIFWKLLIYPTGLVIVSGLLYCIGVYFRPDYKEDGEEKYFTNRIIHGYFMKLSISTLIIKDLKDFINIYYKFII
jgi:hypothetical protein